MSEVGACVTGALMVSIGPIESLSELKYSPKLSDVREPTRERFSAIREFE